MWASLQESDPRGASLQVSAAAPKSTLRVRERRARAGHRLGFSAEGLEFSEWEWEWSAVAEVRGGVALLLSGVGFRLPAGEEGGGLLSFQNINRELDIIHGERDRVSE